MSFFLQVSEWCYIAQHLSKTECWNKGNSLLIWRGVIQRLATSVVSHQGNPWEWGVGTITARPLRARLSSGWKTLLHATNPAQGWLWQRLCSQYWSFHEKDNSLATPFCEPLSSMGGAVVLPQMCVWVTKSAVPLGIDFQSCQKHHRHKQTWCASFRGTQALWAVLEKHLNLKKMQPQVQMPVHRKCLG